MAEITENDLAVYAAYAGNYRVLRERVEAGADLNHIERQKGTALYAAVKSPLCIAYLLSRGANPNSFSDNDGHTALDRALDCVHFGSAHSAFLLHAAGAKSNVWTVLPSPSSDPVLVGTLTVSAGNRIRLISAGQIAFGRITLTKNGWHFDWNIPYGEKTGHLFRLEALYLPDRMNVHSLEEAAEGFMVMDYKGNRTSCGGDPSEATLDAAISLS